MIPFLLLSPSSAFARTTTSSNWTPTFLSREEWGADESLGIGGYEVETEEEESKPPAASSTLSEKDKKCQKMIRENPKDFEVRRTETHDKYGNRLLWERRYSPKIKVIVIHHTGEAETAETRKLSGIKRVRAIYKGHTAYNGWGDIGYNYLIDEQGTIYEGRAGGENVVAAHVYCANVGTLGIALIGNFQTRYPSESQLRSLRWLLIDKTQEYKLRPNGQTIFRGERIPTIVTHRDLAPTQCAGRSIQKLMHNIRLAVAKRDYTSSMLSTKEKTSRQVGRIGKKTYEKKELPRRVQSKIRAYMQQKSGR